MKTAFNLVVSSLIGLVVLGFILFYPAGTFDYWQAWVFLGVFVSASAVVTIYLAIHDPGLLERRMRGGPTAEKEKRQKVIMSFAVLGFIALLVVSAGIALAALILLGYRVWPGIFLGAFLVNMTTAGSAVTALGS